MVGPSPAACRYPNPRSSVQGRPVTGGPGRGRRRIIAQPPPGGCWRAVLYMRAAASGAHLRSIACEEWGQEARGRHWGLQYHIRSNPGAPSLLS